VDAIETVPGMLRIKRLVVNAQEASPRVKGSMVISKVMAKSTDDTQSEDDTGKPAE